MTPSNTTQNHARTALVTGATGFLGAHLVRRLVREGFQVHILCRSQSDLWRLHDLLPRITRHVLALEERARLQDVATAVQPAHVFHLAASTVVAGSTEAAEQLVGTNLLGTVNLLEACESVDYRSLVIAGDSFEYAASHAPLRESDSAPPDTLHGITRLAATLYAQNVAATRRRPIAVLRLFSFYGPLDHPRRFMSRVIDAALNGTALALSRPDITRDWVYVEDGVELFLEAARRLEHDPEGVSGHVFNAGSGIATDLGTLVDTIVRLAGAPAAVEWGKFPAPAHDDYPWVADTQQTFSEFDWRPTTTLEAGLSATIAARRRAATR